MTTPKDTQPTDKEAMLAAALVAAQAELTNPAFDATNPFLKNKYATLRAHLDAVRPVLNKHGLAVSQGVVGTGNSIGVVTRLIHKNGGMMTDCIMTTLDKPTGQNIGALTTYLRRYGLAAICGVVGEDDDDGNADAKRAEPVEAPKQAPAQKPKATAKPAPSTKEPQGAAAELADNCELNSEKTFLRCWLPEGKKAHRVLFAGDSYEYYTQHKMQSCSEGDKMLVTIKRKDYSGLKMWWVESYEPINTPELPSMEQEPNE